MVYIVRLNLPNNTAVLCGVLCMSAMLLVHSDISPYNGCLIVVIVIAGGDWLGARHSTCPFTAV